jgi:hypothetical protein
MEIIAIKLVVIPVFLFLNQPEVPILANRENNPSDIEALLIILQSSFSISTPSPNTS